MNKSNQKNAQGKPPVSSPTKKKESTLQATGVEIKSASESRPPMEAGLDVMVEYLFRSNRIRLKSYIVGFETGGVVIVKTPIMNKVHVHYPIGSHVILRYVYDGYVYGIRSKVIHLLGNPHNYSFLSYPNSYEKINLRDSQRIEIVIPVKIPELNDTSGNFIMDISSTGLQLQLAKEVAVYDTLTLSFVLPDGVKVRNLPCTVMRVILEHEKIRVGVRFDDTNGEREKVINYMNQIIYAVMEEDEEGNLINEDQPN